MAIVTLGFDGAVNEPAWARMQSYLRRRQAFGSEADLVVSIAPGLDRSISVSTGESWAHGVLAISDTPQILQSAVIASGSRWDTVVLRRDWAANTATLVMVTGNATEAVAAGLNDTPGTLHDQPLALVKVTAGTQEPTALRDLRANVMDPKRDVGDKFVTCAPTAPFGTILAQGQELSRAQYSRLFARIGTAFGAGDGSTTFNAPNAKGRTIVGLDAANAAFDTRGEVGGSQTHTLLEAEIAAHVHDMGHGHTASVYDAGHSHDMGHGHGRNYGATYGGAGNHAHSENVVDTYDGNNGGLQRKYRPAGAVAWPTGGGGAHDHSMFVDFAWHAQGTGGEGAHAHTPTIAARVGDTGAKGGGQPHNNMPPFLVEHWCVQV